MINIFSNSNILQTEYSTYNFYSNVTFIFLI